MLQLTLVHASTQYPWPPFESVHNFAFFPFLGAGGRQEMVIRMLGWDSATWDIVLGMCSGELGRHTVVVVTDTEYAVARGYFSLFSILENGSRHSSQRPPTIPDGKPQQRPQDCEPTHQREPTHQDTVAVRHLQNSVIHHQQLEELHTLREYIVRDGRHGHIYQRTAHRSAASLSLYTTHLGNTVLPTSPHRPE